MMISSRSLGWRAAGLGSKQQRLMTRCLGVRNFSINSATVRRSRPTRLATSVKPFLAQQSRSLSLFGWGGAAKPSIESESGTTPADVQIGPNTAGLDNVRTIKASHATSEVPEPSQSHLYPPSNLEPKIIEDLQQKITLPHGEAGERIAEIASGETDISTAAERSGYLKEVCGLDFGWGPSTVMEHVLEWLHVTGGLSWTASIVALAVVLRVAMIKPIVDSQIQGQKMREIQPYMAPLREKYTRYMQEGNPKAQEVGLEMKELSKSAGVSYSKAFVPLLIQLPFSFGAFRVLRNAGNLPVPAFVTEDWLWTTDLSYGDPYYIAPAISALAIHLGFKLQQKGQTNTMFGPEMMKVFSYAIPGMSFFFMMWQPGSVQLYFMTTGLLAYATTATIRQSWFRNMSGLGPLPTGSQPTSGPQLTRTSSASQPVTKKLPSNIQRIAPTSVSETQPKVAEPQVDTNQSKIDQAMDRGKGWWKSMKEGSAGNMWKDQKNKKEAEVAKAASARYEAIRKREMSRDREARNLEAKDRQL